jgi:hypothetical protein
MNIGSNILRASLLLPLLVAGCKFDPSARDRINQSDTEADVASDAGDVFEPDTEPDSEPDAPDADDVTEDTLAPSNPPPQVAITAGGTSSSSTSFRLRYSVGMPPTAVRSESESFRLNATISVGP